MSDDRFDRNERLFGRQGQRRLRETTFAIVGCGGLGSHVGQQCSLLGAGGLSFIDHEEASASNRNRYIGLYEADPVPGSWKVDLAARLAKSIDSSVVTSVIRKSLLSADAFEAVRSSDVVFGCVDDDGVRFVLNELCLAYGKPLFDLASDVPEPGHYGGRVIYVGQNGGCLFCRAGLSQREIRRLLSPATANANEDAVYGVAREALGEVGPSVVYVNGVVASLGVQEATALVTDSRAPFDHLEYRGHEGVVRRRQHPTSADCVCCSKRGVGKAAQVEAYIRD